MLYKKSILAVITLFLSTIVNRLSIIYNKTVQEELLMISYEPFYRTLKNKNISTYKLINQYGISRSLLDRLKHNKPISTVTLDDLCKILSCKVEDILSFVDEKER